MNSDVSLRSGPCERAEEWLGFQGASSPLAVTNVTVISMPSPPLPHNFQWTLHIYSAAKRHANIKMHSELVPNSFKSHT